MVVTSTSYNIFSALIKCYNSEHTLVPFYERMYQHLLTEVS